MITPSFSPTATERVLPRLALDFTTALLDPRVTVTRALNTATRVNSSGFIETVNADLPRFDYDPTTLACKGLLIEETRTNLINQSDNFAAASWTANTSTVSPNAAISPDGTQNADRWVSDPGSTSHYLGQSYTSSASISYTFSVWVKSATGSNQTFRLFVQSSVASGNLTASTSWQRFTLTLPSSAAGSFVAGLTRNSSNDPVDLFVYGAQLEAGAFATSYIPTTTTSLTRNADAVSMTGTNFSDWYTPNSSLFFAASLRGYNTGTHNCVGSISNNANTQYLDYRLFDRFTGATRINGNAGQLIALQAPALNTRYKVGTSNNNTVRLAGAMSGNAVVASGVAGTFAGAEKLNIGRRFDGASDYLNGCVEAVYSYPLTITDAELRAFSK